MLNQGEILEERYRIEYVLFEGKEAEYYHALKEPGSTAVIISRYQYEDVSELENRIKEIANINKYVDTGILKMIECFRKEMYLFIVQEAPKGISAKEKILNQGAFDRKTALKISLDLACTLSGLADRWPRRLVDDLGIERVYLTIEDSIEIIAVDRIVLMTELGKGGDLRCIRDFGILMYQLVTGNTDILKLRNSAEPKVADLPSNIGKGYSEVIRKCFGTEYIGAINPFKQICKDLRHARLFDNIFGGGGQRRVTQQPSDADLHQQKITDRQPSDLYSPSVDSGESDTVRLDQSVNEPEIEVKKHNYRGRFDIVRNDIWIHSREKI